MNDGVSDAEVSLEAEEHVVNDYRLGSVLGEGAYGEVREGFDTAKNNEKVAVKVLSRSFLKKKREFTKVEGKHKWKTALDDVMKEIAIMKKSQHPNLVRLIEAIDNEETDNLYMVLEFVAGGQVMTWNGGKRRYYAATSEGGDVYDEPRAKELSRDIISGLRYLHTQGIIHRDLKPENLLLTSDGRCKIADFGIAQKLDLEKKTSISITNMVGTFQFMAPEMITEDKYKPYEIDLWAFGICLHAFVLGELPFNGGGMEEVFASITNDEMIVSNSLSSELQDALTSLLQKDPEKRATMDEILQMAWFEFSQIESFERIEISEEEKLDAITPVKLDIFKIVRMKGMARKIKLKASASARSKETYEADGAEKLVGAKSSKSESDVKPGYAAEPLAKKSLATPKLSATSPEKSESTPSPTPRKTAFTNNNCCTIL